jgi:tetratricopeptide (TPR) repeat protein
MRTKFPIVVVLLLTPLVAIAGGGASWKGHIVLLKGDKEVKIGKTDPKGVQVYLATLKGISYRVIDDKDGWVKVAQDDAEGWFPKNDAVPLDDAAAYFSSRVKTNPRDDQAFGYRAEAAMLKEDFPAALKDLSEAIKIKPLLATWWNNRAFVLLITKDFDKALGDVNEALRLDPGLIRAYLVRGHIYRAQKLFDKAVAEYDRALGLDPKFLDAVYARANTRYDQKNFGGAVKDYEALLHMQPKHEDALNELAWLLATCSDDKVRDGKKSLDMAKSLNKLTNEKSPEHLDTLAAAYAEVGQFMEAVRYMKMALSLGALPKDIQEGFEKRLKLYEQNKKYRDE